MAGNLVAGNLVAGNLVADNPAGSSAEEEGSPVAEAGNPLGVADSPEEARTAEGHQPYRPCFFNRSLEW